MRIPTGDDADGGHEVEGGDAPAVDPEDRGLRQQCRPTDEATGDDNIYTQAVGVASCNSHPNVKPRDAVGEIGNYQGLDRCHNRNRRTVSYTRYVRKTCSIGYSSPT